MKKKILFSFITIIICILIGIIIFKIINYKYSPNNTNLYNIINNSTAVTVDTEYYDNNNYMLLTLTNTKEELFVANIHVEFKDKDNSEVGTPFETSIPPITHNNKYGIIIPLPRSNNEISDIKLYYQPIGFNEEVTFIDKKYLKTSYLNTKDNSLKIKFTNNYNSPITYARVMIKLYNNNKLEHVTYASCNNINTHETKEESVLLPNIDNQYIKYNKVIITPIELF